MARKGKLCIRMAKLKQNKANISKKNNKTKNTRKKESKKEKVQDKKKKKRRNSQRVVANAGNQRKAKVMKI